MAHSVKWFQDDGARIDNSGRGGNMADLSKDRDSLTGRWHLLAAEWPEHELPHHRVDLVFHDDADGLRGAIRSRVDDTEIPLQAVTFSGGELRVQMAAPPGGLTG